MEEKNNVFENVSIKNLTISQIIPNIIDNVIINIVNNKREIRLPKDMSGYKLSEWMQGRGGIFSRDIKSYINGTPNGNYFLLEEDKIIRVLEDNEIESSNNIIDGKINNKYYTIIRKIKNGEGLTQSNKKEEMEEIESPKIIINPYISSNSGDSDNYNEENTPTSSE
jgi:hypothetical protein